MLKCLVIYKRYHRRWRLVAVFPKERYILADQVAQFLTERTYPENPIQLREIYNAS